MIHYGKLYTTRIKWIMVGVLKKNRHDFITTEIQQPQSLFIFYFLYVQYERRGRGYNKLNIYNTLNFTTIR